MKIALLGTGVIAETHAAALIDLGLNAAAVVDLNLSKAQSFAEQFSIPNAFSSLADMKEAISIDSLHILTPPPTHAALAEEGLKAGYHVFLEKPAAVTSAELDKLTALAQQHEGQAFSVNQNSLFIPAFKQAYDYVQQGAIGPIQTVSCSFAAPLRQLEAQQFSHWMFAEPHNILLEQAVHPLAQLQAISGHAQSHAWVKSPPIQISGGKDFYQQWGLTFVSDNKVTAQLNFVVGVPTPSWTLTIVGIDGSIEVDMMKGTCSLYQPSKWLEAMDHLFSGRTIGKAIRAQTRKGFINYCKSMIGLSGRQDSFFLGMRGSIENFYSAVDNQASSLHSFSFAERLTRLCSDQAAPTTQNSSDLIIHRPGETLEKADLALIGGTGFIGRHLTQQLLNSGKKIRILARTMSGLPDLFTHKNITLVQGDARDSTALATVTKDMPVVLNLAHGGGGHSADAVLDAMWSSAQKVAEACVMAKVAKLVHIGSIAGLYLGDKRETISGRTLADPTPNTRSDYARAKAITDERLIAFSEDNNLPLVILRPGVVLGEGTSPFHSGFGVFNIEKHCLGWSKGDHVLPLILAEDVASACILSAEKDGFTGCYNLSGDTLLGAKDYIKALAQATGRPLVYHAQSPFQIYLEENVKVLIKKIAGKKQGFHSLREFKSRAMFAHFDCSDIKNELGWKPESDMHAFKRKALEIHKRA
ncbi:NAD-dependent epimerase/dehydratase family protein [Temperatibacter marinus]|uniref:NAD-dependent epimerase/dehydratase family protein n=1 Tax=Temperatibacter marinus TaxID=1456591 RepID=A0AA52EFE4_9PROT|nr:NAD-dependent epimerase/dehydratase family protein [Temperatibacter marinus]WND02668.1 NAD-dependent epimerase/dehydratase family protein [Temperatibacter marinus]